MHTMIYFKCIVAIVKIILGTYIINMDIGHLYFVELDIQFFLPTDFCNALFITTKTQIYKNNKLNKISNKM